MAIGMAPTSLPINRDANPELSGSGLSRWAGIGSGVDRIGEPDYNADMEERVLHQPAEFARLAIDVASEKQASDIVMLDIRGLSDFADYFVILTAESTRQMQALAEEIEMALDGKGATLHHREGTPKSGWMLLDFGDVIVHLFGPEEREYYHIEGAWPKAVEVVRIQ